MLHVEHGHVLVNDHLEEARIDAREHRGQLLPVQVITRSQSLQAGAKKDGGGQLVGHVKGIIADEGSVGELLSQKDDGGQIADEHGVGLAVGNQAEHAIFAWFNDAQRGQNNAWRGRIGRCGSCRTDGCHGVPITSISSKSQ